jgi:2-isopropylmalate synthase
MGVIAYVKRARDRGFDFAGTGAQASLYLWLAKFFNFFELPFSFESVSLFYREAYSIKKAAAEKTCEATMRIIVPGVNAKKESFVSEGYGPINAFDLCLKKGLLFLLPEEKRLEQIKIVDYSVVDLDGLSGSAAKIRVAIAFSDGEKTWKTLNCHENMLAASAQAIRDGYCYPFFLKTMAV